MDFCPNCFEKINPDIKICPHCGNDVLEPQKDGRLPYGTMLNDQFQIGKSIGQGGFGITYKAYDTFNNRIVCVKEYMPSEFAHREGMNIVHNTDDTRAKKIFENGKTSYIAEIKTLYKFSDEKNIVKIIQHFTENNTVYLIMEFLDGYNLKSAMSRNGGKLDIGRARSIIWDIAKILEKVHREGILHRDISPENIFIVSHHNVEEVKLIDFGAAKNYVDSEEKDKSIFLKPGFAPPEQYSSTGKQGPYTDVYALAATLYYVVSGVSVQDAKKRMENDQVKPLCELVPNVSVSMSKAIERAMQLDYTRRTKDCTEFLADLDKSGWTEIGKPINVNTGVANSGGGAAGANSKGPYGPPVAGGGKNNYMQPPVNSKGPFVQQVTPPVKNNPPFPPVNAPVQNLICSVVAQVPGQNNKTYNFAPMNTIVIGRYSNECNFVPFNDSHISRKHCTITYDARANVFRVTDLSSNGTFRLSGQRLVKNRAEIFKPNDSLFLAHYNNILTLRVYKQ